MAFSTSSSVIPSHSNGMVSRSYWDIERPGYIPKPRWMWFPSIYPLAEFRYEGAGRIITEDGAVPLDNNISQLGPMRQQSGGNANALRTNDTKILADVGSGGFTFVKWVDWQSRGANPPSGVQYWGAIQKSGNNPSLLFSIQTGSGTTAKNKIYVEGNNGLKNESICDGSFDVATGDHRYLHMVAFSGNILDGTSHKFFWDGAQQAHTLGTNTGVPDSISNMTRDCFIGARNNKGTKDSTGNYYSGPIMWWTHELDVGQINYLYRDPFALVRRRRS